MPIKIHLPPEAAIKSTILRRRNKFGADLRTHAPAFGGDDVAQPRFCALDVDGNYHR